MARQITCVALDESVPGRGIDCVGGRGWTKSEVTVIAEIEAGAEYYVNPGGAFADVVVAERESRKYLRTDPDQTPANVLLLLPECPWPAASFSA